MSEESDGIKNSLEGIERLTSDGFDVNISRMPEHAAFGFGNKICLSIRRGYETPRRLYADTLSGAISMI